LTTLIHQRCWHHGDREAVVRCPACRRFYCRECVIEHQGRMICAACVNRDSQIAAGSGPALWAALGVCGLLLAWVVFYYLGTALARVPSDFFE
jgi:hypothetical protein